MNEDTLAFTIISTLIQATYKLILCNLRRMCHHNPDNWAAPLAGLIAGLWLKFDQEHHRKNLVMILVCSKALDCMVNMLFDRVYEE